MPHWSDQRQVGDRPPRFLLDTNRGPCCHMQPAGTTHSPVKAALNCIHNFAKFPPPNQCKIKKAVWITQVKTAIALRQNCDQSATVWLSTWSSAWHWWVREWRLNLNKSTENKRTPTLKIRDILLDWMVLFVKEPIFFCYRAYMITKYGFNWWVHHEGVCRHTENMTKPKPEACRHGTLEWLCLAYTTVRLFSTDCRNKGSEFPLHCIILYR